MSIGSANQCIIEVLARREKREERSVLHPGIALLGAMHHDTK